MELVEPEAVTVKEEKSEPAGSEEERTEADVQLIGDDGERPRPLSRSRPPLPSPVTSS